MDHFWQPLSQVYGTIEIAASLVGEDVSGSFFGIVQRSDGLYLVVGRIQSQGDLDPVVTASAACSFIKEELQRFDPERVYAHARALFVFEVFECMHYVEHQPWRTTWRMAAQEAVVPPLHSEATHLIVQQVQQLVQAGQAIVMHTYTGDLADKIEVYVRRFSYLPTAELIDELMTFIGPDADGALICLKGLSPRPLREGV